MPLLKVKRGRKHKTEVTLEYEKPVEDGVEFAKAIDQDFFSEYIDTVAYSVIIGDTDSVALIAEQQEVPEKKAKLSHDFISEHIDTVADSVIIGGDIDSVALIAELKEVPEKTAKLSRKFNPKLDRKSKFVHHYVFVN
jgi:hypothetical protein